MNLNKKIITYSQQVGLVLCCFCFHARTVGLLWLPDSSFERSPGIEDTKYTWFACRVLRWLRGGECTGAETCPWALLVTVIQSRHWGLKGTDKATLCLKARGWWFSETSGNVSNTPPMPR